jgi:hypothetical protein
VRQHISAPRSLPCLFARDGPTHIHAMFVHLSHRCDVMRGDAQACNMGLGVAFVHISFGPLVVSEAAHVAAAQNEAMDMLAGQK